MLDVANDTVPTQALVHSLNDLRSTHDRLIEQQAASARDSYALDVGDYLKPNPAAVNRQALVQSIVDKCECDSVAIAEAYDMACDSELLADYHAMAWQDAQEQSLATLSRVCNEHMPADWRANPSADNGQIRLSSDGRVTLTVRNLLRQAESQVERATDRTDQAAISALSRVGQALAAVDRAFKSAAVVLLSYDIEDSMADLMINEMDAALMA